MPVGRTACQVIGVLEEKDESMRQDRDKTILMPAKAVQRRLLGKLDVQTIFASAFSDGTTRRVQQRCHGSVSGGIHCAIDVGWHRGADHGRRWQPARGRETQYAVCDPAGNHGARLFLFGDHRRGLRLVPGT